MGEGLFNLNGEMGGAISFEWGNGGGGGLFNLNGEMGGRVFNLNGEMGGGAI